MKSVLAGILYKGFWLDLQGYTNRYFRLRSFTIHLFIKIKF